MPTYQSELLNESKFQGNVVIKFGGEYYSIRQPDSGLAIPRQRQRVVQSLVINPSTIDPKRVSTTIGSYSFTILDKAGMLSRAVKDTGVDVLGQDVEIWLGRSGVSMAFSDYYKLPITKISKVSKVSNGWSFSTKESTDRLNKPLYDTKSRLSGEIVGGTTIITAKDDISDFPSSGYFRLDREIISYTSKDDGTKTFSGCARGEFSTTATDHDDNVDLRLVDLVTDNPINILLKMLTSGSGSGSYDTLTDGLAIDPSLLDVTGMETLRDAEFPGVEFSLALYDITNALQYIEAQILAPCNLRFSYTSTSKLTVVRLNKASFVDDIALIDHNSMVGDPSMSIMDTSIVNKIDISWDYNEDTGQYRNRDTYTDDDSISTYGKTTQPLSFEFKGVSDQDFVDAFAAGLLDRLSTPKPEIEVKTFISKSLTNVGQQSRMETTRLPNENGQLNFAADTETISRAINYKTGDVKLKLVYTGYTNVNLGFISPSDTIDTVNAQDEVELGAGRGDLYMVGWKMRLWNNLTNDYEADDVNEISDVTGDVLTFSSPWSTTLTTDHRLKFADHNEVVQSQKRYAFVGITGSDFSAVEKSYKIVP